MKGNRCLGYDPSADGLVGYCNSMGIGPLTISLVIQSFCHTSSGEGLQCAQGDTVRRNMLPDSMTSRVYPAVATRSTRTVLLNAVGLESSILFRCSILCHHPLAKKVVRVEHDSDDQDGTRSLLGRKRHFRSCSALLHLSSRCSQAWRSS